MKQPKDSQIQPLTLKEIMKQIMTGLAIGLAMDLVCGLAVAGTDKTLVSWVCLANTTQQGGGALTIQRGVEFDGIVFGEKVPGRWMAGSEFFRRTQPDQSGNAAETVKPDELVQLAIVYDGDDVRIYRNGQAYAAYKTKNIDLLKSGHIAVFGLRHIGAGTGTMLAGAVDDARIYNRALSVQEIQSLKFNQASDIKPLAWWDFEGETVKDRAGHFSHHKTEGGVKIKDGRLLLDGKGYLVAARSEGDLKLAAGGTIPSVPAGPFVPETPQWPDQPPASWMTFHLAHPGPGNAMPGDPNCIFDYKGKVHLHYIYRNALGFVFGHVSSDDMVHWKWHKTVLAPPTTGHGMFSGTGFYTKEGRPAIIYHGEGKGRNVVHYPADDNFDSWTEPEIVLPKNADGSVPNIRHWDPDCWLMNDTYYAYSGGKNPQLMKSPDLKNWTYLGDLLHPDYPSNLGIPKDEDISCGNMFKIGNKWMLLCISHPKGARYYLGDFKDENYLPAFHAMMSFGSNQFFAPESVLTRDGRRVMWAWLLDMPIAPTGVQSLPRELELPADGVLRIKPLRELQSLRCDVKQENEVLVKNDATYRLKEIRGDALEMEVTFNAPSAKEFGMDVLCDKNGENGLRVAYAAESKTLKVGKAEAPFELKQGEDLVLRVYIDRNLVEVFANDRQAVVAANKLAPENLDVSLFSKGGDVLAKSVKGWKMKSIYPEGKPEEKNQAREDPVKCTSSADGTITYEPADGAGKGKHIVLVCGEWEYRCEESLPMLAKILARRHGFKCTVLFQMNPKEGTVDPSVRNNIPGMSALKTADMMIVFAMDLTLPDEQMKPFVEFLETGKPVFGIRCTLLSFKYHKDSPYARFDVGNGGYARDIFGESWQGHYGDHGKESTRGLRAGLVETHPILRGVNDVWGPTDVYRVTKLPADATVYLYGQVLTGMNPTDPPNLKKSVMPMAWTREIKRDSGKVSRVVMSTIGAAQDMESEDLRRLYVNSVYWALGLEAVIPQKADVNYVGGEWKASPFGGGKFRGGLKPADFAEKEAVVHAGFFTPSRKGQIWDTWAYFHEGRYYLYYLAGHFNRWDGHELALSDDGVHWKEQGVMIKPREGVKWMGTGHIWKSPDFDRNHTWVMNYSEWFGDKQDIMFATSSNLLNWTKVDEKYRFVQDKRWYKEKGRWDCIDTVVRPDGSLYGYFTADPDPGKVKYRPCGFGFAESKDGIAWTALPPIEGDISGEFGGIQKIGEKYYIIISEGRVAVGARPEGPFHAQKKNTNVFGAGCDIYFPRFFHNAPGGPLVNHFYNNGTVFAAPLKAVDVDRDGILRLKWWKNDDGLKANPVKISLVPAGEGYFPSLKMLDWKPDPARTTVIEGSIVRAVAGTGDHINPWIFFDQGGGKGQCLVFSKDEVAFGNINAAGGDFKPAQTSARGMEFGAEARFRLLIRKDMIELYVNDYLMNLKRVSYNGRIGFMADDRQGAFKDISVWQSK